MASARRAFLGARSWLEGDTRAASSSGSGVNSWHASTFTQSAAKKKNNKKRSTFYEAFLQVLDREHRGCVLAGGGIEIYKVQWATLMERHKSAGGKPES
jgi:hypothetical protein